jgi:hypothetical protein
MASPRLDYLPQEILARIASSGPAESVLALATTCRILYRACYDTLVFKAIIESQRSLWEEDRILDVVTLSRYIGSNDTQNWARFAVADQRAMELRDRIGVTDGTRATYDKYYPKHFENWVPHLFVAKCNSTHKSRSLAVTDRSIVPSSMCAEQQDGPVLPVY